MSQSFKPPRNNRLLTGVMQQLAPWLCQYAYQGLRIEVSPEDLIRLRQYQGQRMLLLPNHPSPEDPLILFDLSRRLQEPFYFVAAREVFNYEGGLRGWLFQQCGVYSVIRGAADRDSFKTTRDILYRGDRRLVIFIEGEIAYRNDRIIPFQPGVLQLALRAQEDLIEEARKQSTEAPSLWVAPLAIRYQVTEEAADDVLDQAVSNLEKAVGLTVQTSASRYDRIRRVGETALKTREELLGLSPASHATLTERVHALQHRLLGRMEAYLDIPVNEPDAWLDRIRAIRNRMDRLTHVYDDTPGGSDYERQMRRGLAEVFRHFYADLDRVVNLLTFEEGVLLKDTRPERYLELIRRLEKDILGQRRTHLARTAKLQVGQIVDLHPHALAFAKEKRGTLQQLCHQLETDMQQMLNPEEASVAALT
ncbi:MAG: lysophospholipid acyltransferase family protein [Candidatus Melainabacteria bacterium]|nr:lysophospholipid acyltransferase family protein [Candidatus Melainabacteria bacterium]